MSRTRRTLPRVGRLEEVAGVREGDARRKLFIIRTDEGEAEYERHARSLRSRLPWGEKGRVRSLSGPPDPFFFDRHEYEYYGDECVSLVTWEQDPECEVQMHALFSGVIA